MDVDDPFFDPDDPGSDHLLFDGPVEQALSVLPDAPEFARSRAGDEPGLARIGPHPDADDARAAEDREVSRARAKSARRVRRPTSGDPERNAEGVPRAPGEVPPADADQPGGGAGNPGADDDLGRVKLYLAGRGKQGGGIKRGTKPRAKPAKPAQFSEAHILFETGNVKHLRDGRTEIQLFVPYDSKDEAVKLTDSYGLLLEAKIQTVKRKAP